MPLSPNNRSVLRFLGIVVGMTVLASIVGYAVAVLSQFAGLTMGWWISLGLVAVIAAWSATVGPAAIWPRATRIVARVVAFLTVLVPGFSYAVFLAIIIHGK